MADIPQNVVIGDEISAAEFNLLRDIGFIVDIAAGETINGATLPVAVYFDDTENEWMACDGNDTARLEFAGIAITNAVNGGVITVQINGRVTGFSGLTVGARYYVQDDRTLGTSAGTNSIFVGVAVSATDIVILGSGKYVELAGVQTVNGVKTLGSIPVLPGSNPTTSNQATRKGYVDTNPGAEYGSGFVSVGINITSDIVIAHGLSRTPKLVKITCITGPATNTTSISIGSGTSTSNRACVNMETTTGSGNQSFNSTILIIENRDSGDTVQFSADLDGLNATNITLGGVVNANQGSARLILWEAWT